MASRESQSWQISVIVFALLTLLLSVSTYLFYRQSQTYVTRLDGVQKSLAEVTQERNAVLYRLQAHKFVLGLADVDTLAAAKNAAGEPNDAAIGDLLKKFDEDMAAFPNAQGTLNYRNLANQWLVAMQDRSSQLLDGLSRERTLEQARTSLTDSTAASVKTALDGQLAAAGDLAAERQRFQDSRTQSAKNQSALAARLSASAKDCQEELARLKKEREQLQAQVTRLTQTVNAQRERLISLRSGDNFENPDGRIAWASQRQQRVWINLGQADGLGRQTSFAVFDQHQAGVKAAKPKGRIEVLQITGPHSAECRILEDKVSDPIVPGDWINTPAWQPGQKLRFALAGFMDLNGDGVSDRRIIKNLITLNGGVIDAELKDDGAALPGLPGLSVNTRYIVLGERPTDTSNNRVLAEYASLLTQAQAYGVESISVKKFLNLMGWHVQETTLHLAQGPPSEKTSRGLNPQ